MNRLVAGVFIVLFVGSIKVLVSAQSSCEISGKSIPELRQAKLLRNHQPSSRKLFRWYRSAMLFYPTIQPADRQTAAVEAARIPRLYNYERLGFFCKWEVRLEEAARIPVKFRLGEVQYVERLERKAKEGEVSGVNVRK